jgi:CubicO group peptidase (beta-lactamase class C family)
MLSARRALLAAAFLAISGPTALAGTPATPAPDPLLGLWATRLDLGPRVHGDLRIVSDRDGFQATIAGVSVRSEPRGDSIQFVFPDQRGRFRGAWVRGREAIDGFWIQPYEELEGAGQSYAFPLTLRSAGPHSWRGTVTPLEDRFTLYLSIVRGPDDSLIAVFRNPERNSIGGATRFRVIQEADSLRFHARPDTTRPQVRLSGAIVGDPPRVRVHWPDSDRVIELSRPGAALAAAYCPRPPGSPAYRYQPPTRTDDGWPTARAQEVGMSEDSLARLVGRLIGADPNGSRPALIHALLIARRGKLVLEEYFFGFGRDQVHDTRSAAKSFASIMLGAAMRQGAAIAPETPVYPLLASLGPFDHPDPRKSRITVAHLMTHTSGLACDENDDSSPGNEDLMQSQRSQPDWRKFTLDLPLAHDPGTTYAYCSGGANLVGAALAAAVGRWIPELFDQAIARPLTFGAYYWNLTPTLDGYTGGGVRMRPRDLLKLGQTYLDGGVWQGRRIVDSSWVRRSTTVQVQTGPHTGDGYAWHLNTFQSGDRQYREYEANGNGGQFLIVVPELDLAVVITAGNYGQYGIWRHFRDDIVAHDIISAIRAR